MIPDFEVETQSLREKIKLHLNNLNIKYDEDLCDSLLYICKQMRGKLSNSKKCQLAMLGLNIVISIMHLLVIKKEGASFVELN